jgi:hypothetical protein
MTEDQVNMAMQTDEIYLNSKYTINLDTLDIQAQINYLRMYFGVKNIRLAEGFYNISGVEGKFSFKDFWDTETVFMTLPVNMDKSFRTPAFARQPLYKKAFGEGVKFEVYNVDENDSTRVRAREYRGVKIDYRYGCVLQGVTT